jgi:DNA-binding SARP family transcriptional activator/tetratricopeptide (TPR) repeat protein
VLLVRANAAVTVDEIIDEVWGERPPPSAAANLRAYVNRLRRILGDGPDGPVLVRNGVAHILTIGPDGSDLPRFRGLARRGRDALATGDVAAALTMLNDGLGLWRGRPLADVPADGPACTAWRLAVAEERLCAAEDRLLALIGVGAHAEAAAGARELLAAEPLRERSHALLMRARYGTGDSAGALAAYDVARRTLAEHLGTEPGPELRRFQAVVLRQEDDVAGPPGAATPSTGAVPRPRQLPAALPTFVGREAALGRLDAAVTGDDATPVLHVTGPAGVGKTTLAVHWAHRAAARFPDGQLYVNLRGFDPSELPTDPADVLRGFLDALGVPANHLPADRDALVGRYRSLLAGRRVLVLLDNARDADQVRPLLPGSPGCTALVTSRRRLASLVVTAGAETTTVGLLDAAEGRRLLERRLGARRVAAARPETMDQIVAACAGLPLTLAVVAARAATDPGLPLDRLVDELREAGGALDALSGYDAATEIRAVFSWSYRALSPSAARLFRLLGLHPGPEFGEAVAASLLGEAVVKARRALAELVEASLAVSHRPGRYRLHDLLHVYAGEMAVAEEPRPHRDAALRRQFDYYLHAISAVNLTMNVRVEPAATPAAPAPGVVRQVFTAETADAWLAAEGPVLPMLITAAIAGGFDDHACALSWFVWVHVQFRRAWHAWAAVQRLAADAARRRANPTWLASALRQLGLTYGRLGLFAEAHAALNEAAGLLRQAGDVDGLANVHRYRGVILGEQGRHRDAIRAAAASADLYRSTGNSTRLAGALNAIGWYHIKLGDYRQAIAHSTRALALYDASACSHDVSDALETLGTAYNRLGRHADAVVHLRRAVSLCERLGAERWLADALTELGDALHAIGADKEEARRTWRRGLDIYASLDHPDADAVRARLRGHPPRSTAATT